LQNEINIKNLGNLESWRLGDLESVGELREKLELENREN